MHCVGCGTSIPEGASFCPECGLQASTTSAAASREQAGMIEPPKKKNNKALGCLVIGAVILLLLYLIGSNAESTDQNQSANVTGTPASATSESSTATETAELPLAVTASELFNAYEGNEASAQSYFGDRPLLVSGTVKKVSLDFSDDPVVELETPNQFMSASANLADDAHDQAGNFSRGDKVKLLCEDVSEVMAIPQLKNCRTAPAGQKSQPIVWQK